MAQAKKKSATRTAKKAPVRKAGGCKSKPCAKKGGKSSESSNMFFVVSMSFLAATLLFADLLMMVA